MAARLLPAALVVSAVGLVLAVLAACGQPGKELPQTTQPLSDRNISNATISAQNQSLHERLQQELAATSSYSYGRQDVGNQPLSGGADPQLDRQSAALSRLSAASSDSASQETVAGYSPLTIPTSSTALDSAVGGSSHIPIHGSSAQFAAETAVSAQSSGSQQSTSVQARPAQLTSWQQLRQEPATTTTTLLEIQGYAVVGVDPDTDVYPNKFVINDNGTTHIEEGPPANQVRPTWKSYLMRFSYKDERPADPESPPHIKYYRWTDVEGRQYGSFFSAKTADIGHISISGSPGADTFASGGIDIFVPGAKNVLNWGVIWYQGQKPWLLGERLGDGSWARKNSGLEVGPAPDCRPASVSWGGETHVFVRGSDNALYWRRGADTWYDWVNLGGLLTSDPACASYRPGEIHLFVRGPEGHLYYRVLRNGSWSPWEDLGGELASGPAVTARSDQQLDVFARGRDGALWWISWRPWNGWSPWTSLGGELASSPAAVACSDRRIDVFAKGANGTLWSRTWLKDSGWLPWYDHGGLPILSSPTAVSWAPNRIDVFVRGAFIDGEGDALYHKWWDGLKWLP